jgi:hypothetical protein
MSLSDDKKGIFTTIGSYTSVIQATNIPDTTNLFPSVNNKNDIVPLLLDILKVVVGTDALQELTGELFTKFIDKIEPDLKKALKNQVTQYNSNDNLPSYFTSSGSGVRVKVKNIDMSGKFKTNPSSQGGQLIYDNTKPNFDSSVYNTIKNGSGDFGVLHMTHDAVTDELIFKANTTAQTPNIGAWLNKHIDNLTIVDKKEFTTNAMNMIYGTVSKFQNRTVNDTHQELVVNQLLQQLISDDDDSFEISPADNAALLARAEEMINGVVNYDMGCGVMASSLSLSGLTALINNISGTTGQATDPNYVGNQINNTINQSTHNPAVSNANKETIKDGFFQKLINLITLTLSKALTTNPQIRAILAIVSAFQNQGTAKITQAKDDLKNFKTLIKCNVTAIIKLIVGFIYPFVVKYLIKLLKPLITKIIKEKTNQYSNLMASLAPAIAKVTKVATTIQKT